MHDHQRAPSLERLARTGTVALAVLWVAYAVQTLAGVGGATADRVCENVVYDVILALSGLLCLARARWSASSRAAWACLGAGLLAWTAGEVYYTVAAPATVPSLADLGYLALYPCAYVAVVLMLRAHVSVYRRRMWLDGGIVALAGASVASALAAGPILETAVDGDRWAVATNLSYPVADLLLLALVLGALGIVGRRAGRSMLIVAAGLATLALCDGTYLFQSASGTYMPGGILDAGWTLAAVFIAVAAWAPDHHRHQRPVSRYGTVVAPTLATLAAVAVQTVDHFAGVDTAATLLASATLAAVALRMALAFAENEHMVRASQREAVTDALTGLGNRRRLNQELQRAIAQPPPEGRTHVLVLLDLDGFKAYNDAFGHPAGDALLARLGTRLVALESRGAQTFRMGGDEFCVLAEMAVPEAEGLATDATVALSERGDGFLVAPSSGHVLMPSEASSATEALHLADTRMYADKARGRASAAHQSGAVLISALREREPDLHDHVTGVAALAVATASALGLGPEDRDEVGRAAELHDIGKMAIPDAILQKPGPLDEAEWEFMRRHTVVGERILAAAPALAPVARLVRASHERWDGAGYPDGLRGTEIPIGARVVAVCDAYEAMVANRPYRAARSSEEALAELQRCATTQFDADVVAAFSAVVAAEASVKTA